MMMYMYTCTCITFCLLLYLQNSDLQLKLTRSRNRSVLELDQGLKEKSDKWEKEKRAIMEDKKRLRTELEKVRREREGSVWEWVGVEFRG